MVVSVTSSCFCASIQSATALRALLLEQLPYARRWRGRRRDRRLGAAGVGRTASDARRLRMAVDGDVGDVGQELGRAVAAGGKLEELRRRVDEPRRVGVVQKCWMLDQVLDEGEIGGDAADAELAQRAVHARDRLSGVGAQAVTFSSSES